MAVYEDILTRASVGGRYKVKRLLGAGAFGEVFLADQELAGVPGVKFREVALKLFTQEYVNAHNAAEVFAEAMTLERLAARARANGDPVHLVTIYDLGVLPDCEGAPYVAMECVRGSLQDEIERSTLKLPLDTVIRHMRGICAGLRLAHENAPAVIHRDLKPANVLIEKNGFLKVADFGLAIERHRAFQRGGHAGTIAYAPPENRKFGLASPAFDVYSLGVMMIEMLTRNNPLMDALEAGGSDKETEEALDQAQRGLAELRDFEGQPIAARLRELRNATGAMNVLRRCLALRSEDRYANAMELDRALGELECGRIPDPPPAAAVESGRQKLARLLSEAGALLHSDAESDNARAASILREVFALDPQEERYFALLSVLHERQGKRAEAIEAQKVANRIAKQKSGRQQTPPDMVERLAALYESVGKSAAARALRAESGAMRDR